ncbi:hypothetical protein [Candidatus Nanopusillus massiliensis]|uniref:hypothetical protein n=1 Tax=Candidatus Nanopusillus massiliensis TaxID=2897163 RepID=UPI001E51FCD3|nr:hypothetical protein [Candidatus Nanopusillus massiliensis]
MFQSEYNRNLDEIIKFSDILSKTLINYLLDGEIKNTIIEDQSYDSTTIKYIGTAYSREPSLGKNIEIIRKLEGILTIEGEKLVLELKKGEIRNKKTYIKRYEREADDLYSLKKLREKDERLAFSIEFLKNQSYLEGIDIREAEIKYNILTGEYKIRVCGKMIEPRSSVDLLIKEKCLYFENKKQLTDQYNI